MTSDESHPYAGYVLVPVNATTRSFLSQFSKSPLLLDSLSSDVPIPLSTKKQPKKRVCNDVLSTSFRPVNKKRGGSLDDPEPTTNQLVQSPYSMVAGCNSPGRPLKEATTIDRVQGLGSMQPKTNKLKSHRSIASKMLPTIIRVRKASCIRRNVSFLKGPRPKPSTNQLVQSPYSMVAGCTSPGPLKKATTIDRVVGSGGSRLPNSNQTHLLRPPFSIDVDDENDDNHIKECLGAADDEGDDQEEEGDQVTARFDNHEMAGRGVVDDEEIYDYDEEEEKEEGVNNNDEEDEDDDEDEEKQKTMTTTKTMTKTTTKTTMKRIHDCCILGDQL